MLNIYIKDKYKTKLYATFIQVNKYKKGIIISRREI